MDKSEKYENAPIVHIPVICGYARSINHRVRHKLNPFNLSMFHLIYAPHRERNWLKYPI